MQLTHERAEGYFFFRAIREDSAVILDRELRRSFIITPEKVIENWTPARLEDIDAAAMEAVSALNPDVFILGTGRTQRFPQAHQLRPALGGQVGIEVMANAAAGRTYNLLAAEGRRVVAAILLPG